MLYFYELRMPLEWIHSIEGAMMMLNVDSFISGGDSE